MIGDKQEDINAQVGDRQSAQTINNVNDVPITWVILFTLMAGWAIPDPATMGRGLIKLLRTMLPWSK